MKSLQEGNFWSGNIRVIHKGAENGRGGVGIVSGEM
jgi:hypothetical protein